MRLIQCKDHADIATEPNPDGGSDQLIMLTVEEVARRLGIGRTTVYGLIKSREIVGVHVGRLRRIHRDEVERYAKVLYESAVRQIAA